MANKTKTSITVDKSVRHIKAALYQEELSCDKITGFHLKKTKAGGTWRLRYSDLPKKRKLITLGRFVDGTKDRLEAAELALSYRGKVEEGDFIIPGACDDVRRICSCVRVPQVLVRNCNNSCQKPWAFGN